ncbi:virion structural protein [Pseudomonas phage PhiPA3]|uniref:Virion structural protein n=1 Tax=Pseudomonas phage PhiPA3 TaxID=998086 RepID=F8SJX4_BPPA3|nr:virion structural protein [Pseudomonas phage PhiPA3]AEH03520.1 virion structural protein [Pseudomonas phage PhiPA3]
MIHNLAFHLGNEDFADAHEPLFDGTGEPPSIETQKNDQDSVGTGETAPAAESPDTPEQKPQPEETAEAETPEDSGEAESVKASELEHEKVEDVEAEEKPLDESTTALENYMPKAVQSAILGFSKRERTVLGSHVKRIHRLAGTKRSADESISLESLAEAVVIGKARLIDLRVQKAHHRFAVSNEAVASVQALTTTKDLPKHPKENQVFHVNGVDWVFSKGQWVTRQGIYGFEDIDPTYSVPKTEADCDNAPLAHDMIQGGEFAEPVDQVEVIPALEAYDRLLTKYKPALTERACGVVVAGIERAAKLSGMKSGTVSVEAYR